MTVDQFKAEYPRDEVFVQIDDVVRVMTPEEYETWCTECVAYINEHPDGP